MNKLISLITLFVALTLTQSYAEKTVEFSSGSEKVQLIELYSSQGCSSCPPAEKWLNDFKDDKRLWNEVVPLGFHVDYWDRLGWEDPFGSKEFSQRQRSHRSKNNIGSVYTPGFVVNGVEWRGWFRGQTLPDGNGNAGVLSATIKNGKLYAAYSQKDSKLEFNYAILGFDLVTKVTSGENTGRTLKYDFIVLKHVKETTASGNWSTKLPDISSLAETDKFAIAVWVNKPGELKPVQATGSWLDTVNIAGN